MKNSVKSVKTAVTSMPNNLINTVGFNLDGIKGALNVSCFIPIFVPILVHIKDETTQHINMR